MQKSHEKCTNSIFFFLKKKLWIKMKSSVPIGPLAGQRPTNGGVQRQV
jgi:hypothetical protein